MGLVVVLIGLVMVLMGLAMVLIGLVALGGPGTDPMRPIRNFLHNPCIGYVIYRFGTINHEPWTMDHGPWTMDHGPWTICQWLQAPWRVFRKQRCFYEVPS